ncbi:hypothetical protein N657DRAFT_445573 [Parathielavia appendiculata]|uniref:Uncharacterized protein n=1 Tax=Parathielavia appendiculata TaxID=2587402 RepID=A0AAN6TZB0_9PEZI|nr:hypothetical protein N657DRAFT_445573 [Parathielavia appendiculata]
MTSSRPRSRSTKARCPSLHRPCSKTRSTRTFKATTTRKHSGISPTSRTGTQSALCSPTSPSWKPTLAASTIPPWPQRRSTSKRRRRTGPWSEVWRAFTTLARAPAASTTSPSLPQSQVHEKLLETMFEGLRLDDAHKMESTARSPALSKPSGTSPSTVSISSSSLPSASSSPRPPTSRPTTRTQSGRSSPPRTSSTSPWMSTPLSNPSARETARTESGSSKRTRMSSPRPSSTSAASSSSGPSTISCSKRPPA